MPNLHRNTQHLVITYDSLKIIMLHYIMKDKLHNKHITNTHNNHLERVISYTNLSEYSYP